LPRCFDAARPLPFTPAPAAAARCARTGARRRASRQMKNETPTRSTAANPTIRIACDVSRPLPPVVDVPLLVVVTVAVLVVGVDACD